MEEWRKIRLGDCIREINERTTVNNQHEVLTSSKKGIISQEDYFDKQVASKNNIGYKIIKKGQFTYRSMSDSGNFTINRLENIEIGIVSPAYPVFEPIDINGEYLKYFFESSLFKQAIHNLSQGSTRTALKYKDLSDIEILLPSTNEQEKIVKLLEKIDIIIEKYKALLKNKKQLINFWFVQLFENKGFKITTLNCVSEIKGEYGLNASAKEYDEELTRYVRITDINEDGTLNDNLKSPNTSKKEINKYLLEEGDVIFARTGATVGKTYKYSKKDGRCSFAGYCIRYRIKKDVINPTYLFIFTKTKKYYDWIRNRQRVGAQPNINSNEYGNELKFPLPPLELQNKFAEIIEQFEMQKVEMENLIKNYKLLKKGLMQKLFTGKVRVNV